MPVDSVQAARPRPPPHPQDEEVFPEQGALLPAGHLQGAMEPEVTDTQQ